MLETGWCPPPTPHCEGHVHDGTHDGTETGKSVVINKKSAAVARKFIGVASHSEIRAPTMNSLWAYVERIH